MDTKSEEGLSDKVGGEISKAQQGEETSTDEQTTPENASEGMSEEE